MSNKLTFNYSGGGGTVAAHVNAVYGIQERIVGVLGHIFRREDVEGAEITWLWQPINGDGLRFASFAEAAGHVAEYVLENEIWIADVEGF